MSFSLGYRLTEKFPPTWNLYQQGVMGSHLAFKI